MECYTIENIQQKIYQTSSTNEPVIFEYELAKLLQIDVKRLHNKLSAATHIIHQFTPISDSEFEYLKRKYKYNKNWKNNQYCNVFTKEQITKFQDLFQPNEAAHKIIPTIIIAFSSLIIPYEDKIKQLIKRKRRIEQLLRWALITIGLLIMCLIYIGFKPSIDNLITNEVWNKIISVAWFLIEPVLATMFSWEKMFNWIKSENVEKEYQSFNGEI